MNQNKIIEETILFVEKKLSQYDSSHDFWHTCRVWNNAKKIAAKEGGDVFVIELASLLHDIADAKYHNGDENIGPKMASDFLAGLNVDPMDNYHISNIIYNISFKGGTEKEEWESLELDVVQDADRLDAIGAIGIARTFNYGGFNNRPIYDPEIKPKKYKNKKEYRNSDSPTINHFYEKLLLLKDLMNTATAKEMAEERHLFMEVYLERFFDEWEGRG